MVDLRINETLQTGAVRKPHLPFCRLVGTVSNSADAVRLETAPTGERECLFIFRIHHNSPVGGISEFRLLTPHASGVHLRLDGFAPNLPGG